MRALTDTMIAAVVMLHGLTFITDSAKDFSENAKNENLCIRSATATTPTAPGDLAFFEQQRYSRERGERINPGDTENRVHR